MNISKVMSQREKNLLTLNFHRGLKQFSHHFVNFLQSFCVEAL